MQEQGQPPSAQDQWHVREGLSLRQAEELLDWLDQHGATQHEVAVDATGTTVRWRQDPAHWRDA